MVPIKDNPNYHITSDGRIFSFVYGRKMELRPTAKRKGHLYVTLSNRKKFLVHRLVAMHFIPNPDALPLVCHKNGNPKDNRAENLYWGTMVENYRDAYNQGTAIRGEKTCTAKLTEQKVREIRSLYPQYTYRKIAEMYGMKKSTIFDIVRNKLWRHVN